MRQIIISSLFILSSISAWSQFIFDPFDFRLNDSTLTIQADTSLIKEPQVALFDNTYIWFGLFPNTQAAVKMLVEHDLVLINNESAIDDNNKIYISVSNDSLMDFRLRVIENGKVVKEHSAKDLILTEEDNARYKILAVEGLKKGQMIERLIVKLQNYSESGSIILQQNYLTKKRFVSISAPAIVKFAIKSYPEGKAFIDTVLNEETRYQFCDIGEIPPYKDEAYSFTQARKMRLEFALEQNFSTNKKFNSWADKGRNLLERLVVSEKNEKKFIAKLVVKEGWDKLSGKEQVFAIESYVKNNVNTSESMPFVGDVEKLFKLKYGSNYAVSRAYIMIFEELKIKWELVFSTVKSQKEFDESFPSSAFIEDILFYFPSLKMYSDPEDGSKRVGEISFLYEGQKGMFVRPMLIGDGYTGVTRIQEIGGPSMNDITREYDIEVSWTDELESKINTRFKGNNHANDSRKVIYTFADRAKADEITEEQIRGDRKEGEFKVLEIKNYDLNKFEEYYLPFEISYEWKTDAYLDHVGNNLLFKYGLLIGQQVELYDKQERTHPIEMYYPHLHNATVKVAIPEGYSAKGFEQKNKNVEYKDEQGNPLFGIDIQVKQEGQFIIMTIHEYYAKSTFSIEEYARFREVINAAADINAYTLLLEKLP